MKPGGIAVVGYAARLPGGGLETVWQNLLAGTDLVTEIPSDRWGVEGTLHPGRSHPATFYTRRAGTIGDISGFDAAFFGISPREAEQLDPQQRLLLELTWEAFEHGGIRPSALRGSRSGVFIGFSGSDWSYRRADDLAALDATSMTGQTGSVAANRISYQFDLRGPSVAVDTACSSSLVAFHQACQSIASGESELALAGGVTLHLHPYAFVGFARASMLSPRGVCNVFDARGDGYVRAEGGGIFVLKPLLRAQEDGDRIFAVVAGSGVNCDGRTHGITVPGVETQAALLREVYSGAGIDPAELDYLEAHGTGTAVGDPIECHSLGLELGRHRPPESPLLIGSVKSNMGHLETASGVAGLAKALLCLEHRQVPPTIHLEKPNPNIPFQDWNLRVVTEPVALDPERRLTIGVNSFGFGGANAHVILQSAEPVPAPAGLGDAVDEGAVPPLLLSARSPAGLRAAAGAMAAHLEGHPELSHYDVAFSAAFHRDWHPERVIAFAADPSRQRLDLAAFAAGEPCRAVVSGRVLEDCSGPVFVYSGNGSQWAGMGHELLNESPVFAEAVAAVDAFFSRHGDFSIVEELLREDAEERLALTEVAQPLLFAVQVGVTEMLRAHGAQPAAVLGHSVGEVAAAWASGALTLKQAVQVIHERSRHQGATRGTGGMTAVGLDEAACTTLLREAGLHGRVAIAGINSPRGVTLAGPTADLAVFEGLLAERELFFRRLALDYAFHSAAMEPIRPALARDLAGLKPGREKIPFYSTVTGGRLSGKLLDAAYWWRNIREPVRFHAAVGALAGQGFNLYLEIGPHAVLRTYVNDGLRELGRECRVIPTLLRGDGGADRVGAAFYQMVADGAPLDIAACFPRPGRFVRIPTYRWQRERYWHPVTSDGRHRYDRRCAHPLLGYRLDEVELGWENLLDLGRFPELADHAVGDAVVFPAAGFVEMALAAGAAWVAQQGNGQTDAAASLELEELEIHAPLILEEAPSRHLRLVIDPADGRFAIRSRIQLDTGQWQLHVTGRLLGAAASGAASERMPRPQGAAAVTAQAHYQMTARVGLDYGPRFQTVQGVWPDAGGVTATLAAEGTVAGLHLPPLLDGCFQLLVEILGGEATDADTPLPAAFLPVRVGRLVRYGASEATSHVRAVLTRRSPRSVVADFDLYDARGGLLVRVEGVRFRAVLLRRPGLDHPGYLRFAAVPRPAQGARPALLPPDADLLTACRSVLDLPSRTAARRQYYGEVEPLLDALCSAFARQALQRLDTGQGPLSVEQLLADGRLQPDMQPYLRNLLRMLQDDGVLEPLGNAWAWSGLDALPDAESIWTSLLGDYPDHAAEILLLGRVGIHLDALLSGRLETAAVLPEDPEQPMLDHYLGSSPSRTGPLDAVAALVAAAIDALEPGQRLRVLEFCDGHPRLAPRILQQLDLDRCDMVVAAAAGTAYEVLSEGPGRQYGLSCMPVDFAESPGAGAFDIVLTGFNLGVHDHPDRLLGFLSRQLLPGGLLAVVEQPSTRWQEMVFGLDPAWWAAGEAVPTPPLRPVKAWAGQLGRFGLADVNLVHDLADQTDGPFILLARSSQAEAVAAPGLPAGEHCWLVMHDRAGPGAVLAELVAARLRGAGQRACLGTAGEPNSADGSYRAGLQHLFDGLREQRAAIEGIVLLQGVPFAATDPEAAASRCVLAAELMQVCDAEGIRPGILLVTAGATADLLPAAAAAPLDDAALWGFGRTLMNEYPDRRIRLLELADPHDPEAAAAAMLQELLQPDEEDEVIYADSGRYAPRLRSVRPADLLGARSTLPDPVTRLDFRQPGPLKNLGWRRASLSRPVSGEVEIAVRSAGLNFRDVMYAMGLLSDEAVETGFAGASLGMELAGVVTRTGPGVDRFSVGDEVVAFAPACFADRVVTQATAVAHKPAGWSFNAAATVPTTFFTAYYALHHLARLEEGERLLIHGAAGGVGLAAIQLGRAMGAEIFATAGSDSKRDIVRLLGADHVFDSRSLAFADEILARTGGEGVDVVLNSLSGEAINRNLRVLRPFGRFLELGKRDFYENTRIGLRPFRNNITYFGIDADQLMAERPALTGRLFGELMELFAEGLLKPLPYRAFPADQAVEAFRYMQQSRQIGKVVLDLARGPGPVEPAPPAAGTLALRGDASYLVTGGMRGFGLETARWMASKGARNLVLLSRRGAADDAAAPVIEALQREGVRVRAFACDVADRLALSRVFEQVAGEMPPLRGIVHAAMVIDDGLVRGLDGARIREVLAPKVTGARNLDALSRDLALDFFVLYSSATTLFGNPGQASYVAANRYLEVLAHARRAAGLPALCVSWGAIGDVGYLARNAKVREQLQSRMGGAALDAAEALNALEQLLLADLSGLGVIELDWTALNRFLPTAVSPKFQELARAAEDAGANGDGYEQLQRWLEEMDDDELAAALAEALRREIGAILHIAPERIEGARPLHDLGMDSLMGMELVSAVETRFGVALPLMALSEGLSLERLVQTMIRQLRGNEDAGDANGTAVARVAAQHAAASDDPGLVNAVAAAVERGSGKGRSLLDDR
jgi:acyl transferase domain-containing protein/NADPH:quinone reductase-like Zn-dependent oxidoreductase/acyl carrier protein